jgi:hypothetical protein
MLNPGPRSTWSPECCSRETVSPPDPEELVLAMVHRGWNGTQPTDGHTDKHWFYTANLLTY